MIEKLFNTIFLRLMIYLCEMIVLLWNYCACTKISNELFIILCIPNVTPNMSAMYMQCAILKEEALFCSTSTLLGAASYPKKQ